MTATGKRQQILAALESLLCDRRFDEVTVDLVAELAGVGKGTVYRYFEDKEDLFYQMIQELLREEIADIATAASDALAPREKLIAVGETISAHIQRHGQFIRMMHAIPPGKGKMCGCGMMKDHHEKLDKMIAMLFREAADAGLLRDDLEIRSALCIFKGAIMSRSIQLIHGVSDVPVAVLVDTMVAGFGKGTWA